MNRSASEDWDRAAATFDDEADHGLRDPLVRQAWDDLVRRLVPDPPSRVVDLGCGTGSLSVLLAERGHAVTGIDLSPRMLTLARQKARAAGVSVDFQLGDAERPDLSPMFFDVVLCRHVLWALPDPAAAVRRWVDLLRQGGIAVLIEGRWSTGTGITAKALRHLIDQHVAIVTSEPLNDPQLWGKDISDERYVLVARPISNR